MKLKFYLVIIFIISLSWNISNAQTIIKKNKYHDSDVSWVDVSLEICSEVDCNIDWYCWQDNMTFPSIPGDWEYVDTTNCDNHFFLSFIKVPETMVGREEELKWKAIGCGQEVQYTIKFNIDPSASQSFIISPENPEDEEWKNFNCCNPECNVCIVPKSCLAENMFGKDSEQVKLLRKFRDEKLTKTELGKAIIRMYYKFEPTIGKQLEKHPLLKEICRNILQAVLLICS